MTLPRTPRAQVIAAVVGLAVLSLVFNISLPGEMSGDLPVVSFVRKSITMVLNSGTAWAGIAVFAGWRSRTVLGAILAGFGASVGALLLHYLLGIVATIYAPSILAENVTWFQAAALFCGPLGAVGWLARRRDVLGLLAAMVVPLGALLEPFALRHFGPFYPRIPWPVVGANIVSGIVLIVLGLALALLVLVRRRRSRRIVTSAPR